MTMLQSLSLESGERALSVLHVTQPTVDGVARCVADLVADQSERGWRVGVASPPEGPLQDWAVLAGADHHSWEAGREVGSATMGEVSALAGIVDRFVPDVVHLHSSKAGLAGRLMLRGSRPTIFQPHCWSWVAATGAMRTGAAAWERTAARWADAVLCVSADEAHAGHEGGVRAPFRIVPNGVDLTQLTFAGEAERLSARADLGLGEGPLVLCVGRLSRQKGQDILLDAWPLVRESVPSAVLVLVGEGPERDRLATRAQDGVRLVGQRDDVATWIAASDVVAMPSRWEGMALTTLECMARGRSLVVSDVEGMREAIGTGLDSNAGAVVPPEDVPSLAKALVVRLLDPMMAAREGGFGRRRAESYFDLARSTSAVAKLTAEVAGRGNKMSE